MEFSKGKPQQWDSILPHAEFAHNSSHNRSTQMSPFEIVYRSNPTIVLDLILIQWPGRVSVDAEEMKQYIKTVHEEVWKKIVATDTDYKEVADWGRWKQLFTVGDLRWVHMWKERFPIWTHNKLIGRKIGPCKVIKEIYHQWQCISGVFNIEDLTPYWEDASVFY